MSNYNEELSFFLARHLYERGSEFTTVDHTEMEPVIYQIELKRIIKDFLDNRSKS